MKRFMYRKISRPLFTATKEGNKVLLRQTVVHFKVAQKNSFYLIILHMFTGHECVCKKKTL